MYVPNASKKLLSIHRFTYDDHFFIEFHHFFLLIKDQIKFLDPPIFSLVSSSRSLKHAFMVTKPSQAKWHSLLDHPSVAIVRKIIIKHKLTCVRDLEIQSFRDEYQRGKVINFFIMCPAVYIFFPIS